ncbi:MAG: hypothetical protein MUC83_14950 [Pirellula sp.]|jgi:hypothetical protein|nr:hypothetical protein [Pirellula sp.]
MKNILWIDGQGGYLLCDSEEVILGQAVPECLADLAIRGDISRRAASIRRVGEEHVLNPLQESYLDGRRLERPVLMPERARITLGKRVELAYIRPSKLSCSARLEIQSNNRWQPLFSSAVLLGDSCVLGPFEDCHILCPTWSSRLVLFRQSGAWFCRPPQSGAVQVGGKIASAPFNLNVGQKICTDEFSMILE